jgi:ABC-type Fe3+/spermidine/putrescine transport system ATPase subunit
MLDEPLGSLDGALRARLVIELRRIVKSVGLTTVYVTHDQQEAFAIADRIALMNAGKIEQADTPETIYRRPATRFCATFLGLNNIVPVNWYTNGMASTAFGMFAIPHPADAILLHPLGIRLSSDGPIEGRIEERTFQGDSYQLLLGHASGLAITLNVTANADPIPAEGETARIAVGPDHVLPLRESA